MRWVADHQTVIYQEIVYHHGRRQGQCHAKGNRCISFEITTSTFQLPAVTLCLLY